MEQLTLLPGPLFFYVCQFQNSLVKNEGFSVLIFVFWYDIDFVICGSLNLCAWLWVYLLLFFKKEKPHFEGWETLKKGYCTFIYF